MRLILNYIYNNVITLFFLFFSIIFFGNFLFTTGDIISQGDIAMQYKEGGRINEVKDFLFSDFGSQNNIESFNLLNYYRLNFGILKLLNIFSMVNFYKLSLILAILISYFGSFFYFEQLLKNYDQGPHKNINNIFGIGALFYTFSPFILNTSAAAPFWIAYSILPLTLYVTHQYFNVKFSIKFYFLAGLFLSLLITGTHYFFYGVFIILIQLLLNIIFFNEDKKNKIFEIIYKGGFLIFLFSILNAHRLLTVYDIYNSGNSITPGYEVTKNMLGTFSQNSSLIKNIVHFDNRAHIQENILSFFKTNSSVSVIFRFIPVLVGFYGWFANLKIIIKSKNNHIFLGFLFVFLFFWYLSVGINNPIYEWLIFDSPLKSIGWMFRVPAKLTFIFPFFISIGLVLFFFNKKNSQNGLIYILFGFIILLPIFNKIYSVYNYYALPGELPVEYKELFSDLKTEQNKNKNFFKALFLAPYSAGFNKNKLSFETSYIRDDGKIAGSILEASSPIPSIGFYRMTFKDWQNAIYSKIYPQFLHNDPGLYLSGDIGDKYLKDANIKYLIVHNDIYGAEKEGNKIIKNILNQTDLVFIRKYGTYLYLFEIQNPRNVLYLEISDQERKINFLKMNPTKYAISIKNLTSNKLNFTQVYDKNRTLCLDNLGDGQCINSKKNENGLIYFDIPSGIYVGYIIYKPQLGYELGSTISLIGIIITLICLLFYGKFNIGYKLLIILLILILNIGSMKYGGKFMNGQYIKIVFESGLINKTINPTKYHLSLNIPTTSTGEELKFLQSFHSERKLYPGPSWTCDQPHTMTGQDIQYLPILAKVNTGQTLTQLITQYQITTGEILDRNTGVTVTGGLWIGQQIVVGQQTGTVREYQTTECLQSGYTFFQGEELGYLWKKPLRDEGHTMVYDYANGRDISLTGSTGSQILAQGLQEGWIRPHTDGSYQVDLVLYFRPQSWFYLGLMISGTTLIGLLSRLLYGWVRERRTREDAT